MGSILFRDSARSTVSLRTIRALMWASTPITELVMLTTPASVSTVIQPRGSSVYKSQRWCFFNLQHSLNKSQVLLCELNLTLIKKTLPVHLSTCSPPPGSNSLKPPSPPQKKFPNGLGYRRLQKRWSDESSIMSCGQTCTRTRRLKLELA